MILVRYSVEPRVFHHPVSLYRVSPHRFFVRPLDLFTRPVVPSLLLRRNLTNYHPFSHRADLSTVLIRHHQMNSFPLFRGHFSSPPRSRAEVHDTQADLRRAYGISENEDLYGGIVQRANDNRHADAVKKNTDGGTYLKSVVEDHLQSLSDKDKAEFKKKVGESDPEIFIEVPRLAVKKAISSTAALTKSNTPLFMHKHLDQLEQLRKKQNQLQQQELWKQCCDIATSLARESDCIASMQKALFPS